MHKFQVTTQLFSIDSNFFAVINQHRKMSIISQVHARLGPTGDGTSCGAHSVHACSQRMELRDASVLNHWNLVVLRGQAVGDSCCVAVPKSRVYIHRSSCQVLLKHLPELHRLATQQGHGVLHRQPAASPGWCVVPHVSSHMNLEMTQDVRFGCFYFKMRTCSARIVPAPCTERVVTSVPYINMLNEWVLNVSDIFSTHLCLQDLRSVVFLIPILIYSKVICLSINFEIRLIVSMIFPRKSGKYLLVLAFQM